jgi:predicted DCC family thiol-disulfide oxidoreductase YuxK
MRDEEATALLARLPESERYATWHLLLPGRPPVGYGTGARELAVTLRLTRPLGGFLRVVPEGVLDAAYRLVARHRSQLGRLVPDGAAPRTLTRR